MNHVTKTAVIAKNFVANHKVAITFVVTSALCGVANRETIREYDKFLADNDLYDEFHAKLATQ